eukprot:gnl/TRDRNA2_/TRDRNA2_161903_c0_seq1.p1 gnl/TRDRNA2_/TRDRNA2_161903_c0~~gnl/TRDRNA2_/TRDRNA2_161903_c0_seq1.p1  ORF type:complete len:392 (-),score=85.06 gnl/TRDRNA2_/TRDRNA2_161903_c0_seq1:92-1207(-)
MPAATDIEDPVFEVVKIGPCSYRKLVVPENLTFRCDAHQNSLYDEEDELPGELDDQIQYEGDEYVLKLSIPAVFHRFIIGARGKMKQELEMQSGARIIVPTREDLEDAIYLRARQKQQIYSAKAQVELLCEREESKLEYTHFLSVSLAHDAKFKQAVDQLREDIVLQRYDGIDASIFMPAKRMHFTICMLKLHSHAAVEEMKQALEDAEKKIKNTSVFNTPLLASMKGLHIMTDDPSNVGVVFTTDRSHALQNRMNGLGDLLFGILKDRGIVSQQNLMFQRLLSSDGSNAEIKLHATLMNTKYSKTNWRDDGSRGDRETFDASVLMERFGQVDFGTVQLKELQLSCLDEMGDDGYYRSLLNVPICNPASFK